MSKPHSLSSKHIRTNMTLHEEGPVDGDIGYEKMSRSVAKSVWPSLLILIVFLSPDTFTGNLIQIGAFSLFLLLNRKDLVIDNQPGTYLFVVVFVVSFLYSVIFLGRNIYPNDFFKNAMILFFFVFFPVHVKRYRFTRTLLFVMLFVITLTQIVLLFDIRPLSNYIYDIYLSRGIHIYTIGHISDLATTNYYRSGGFLGNANQAAKYINLLLICYFIIASKRPHLIVDLIFGLVYSIALILAGSRTGFIITLVILFVSGRPLKKYKLLIGVAILGVVILSFGLIGSLRLGQISAGFEGGWNLKIALLTNYFRYVSDPIVLLFGNFYSGTGRLYYPFIFSSVRFNFDADMGYFFYAFGLFGLVSLLLKLFTLATQQPGIRVFSPLLLWFLSASLFFHFKFFIIVIMMISFAYQYVENDSVSNVANITTH